MNKLLEEHTKIIYVKYSELTLKRKNRMDFVKKLYKNIQLALKGISLNIVYYYDYLEINNFDEKITQEILKILQEIPGIHSFTIAYVLNKEIDGLVEFCEKLAKYNVENQGIKTFRISAKRQDKSFISSETIVNLVAGKILNNTPLKVMLKNYDWNLQIEVKADKIVVWDKAYDGSDGLPVGSSGRVLVLLSGGIDSPVAARQLMNRGMHVDFLTFITPPTTSEKATQKVRDLAKTITMNGKLCDAKLYICNFTNLQNELAHISKESYRITLMRRRFIKIAKEIAISKNCDAIATGESLGQVASQTINSMQVINAIADNFLILRPLLTYNKNEIIKLAQKYKTYEIAILPYHDSCALFAPKNPVTQPNLKTAIELEKEIDLLDELTKNAITIHTTKEVLNNGEYGIVCK